ncbi:MAG: FMN-binding negative transcriptional regulator [Pseudomonadota bacterium]|nr:FMN-binding negative transcriptional regulator [Pseudomonadota bacterium]
MYRPSHFEQTDRAALAELIQGYPLATLVTVQDGATTADHLPLEFDAASQTLRGHVARANPLWRAAAGQSVLAVFLGPQAYVTPAWYASKAVTHKVVPTWNYSVVHVHGVLHVVDDAPWVHALVTELTAHQEAGRPAPWAVTDAPADFVQQTLRAIVGIEIAVTQLFGKWKISQNRDAADRAGVVAGLQAEAATSPQSAAMAALVSGPPGPSEGLKRPQVGNAPSQPQVDISNRS